MSDITKRRVIPCILLKNGMIIRSEGFVDHKIIGNPISQVSRYTDWNVDELIYIDISETNNYDFGRDDHKFNSNTLNNKFDLVKLVAKHCNMPLGFGGGIRTIEDIRTILTNGADKVILNTIIKDNFDFIAQAANIFGSQAIVACVDYKNDGYVYHNHGRIKYNMKLEDYCQKLIDFGIGEILLQSIDRDGAAEGYDITTIKNVLNKLNVPILCMGGLGNEFDFLDVLKFTSADPVAANWFHFKEQSYKLAKNTILNSGFLNIRS